MLNVELMKEGKNMLPQKTFSASSFFKMSLVLILIFILSFGMVIGGRNSLIPDQVQAAGKIEITLSKKAFSYNGKTQKPGVSVKYDGKKLGKNDYSLTYSKGMKNVGKYYVQVNLKGSYIGSKKAYFYIDPQQTKITSLTSASQGFDVSWEKVNKQITGYQISYVVADSGTDPVIKTVKGNESASITGLQASTRYCVKVRTYKEVKKKKYYSYWSSAKYVNTKNGENVYTFRNKDLKDQHYQKHGKEMGFASADDYEAAASAVVTNPAALHKLEKEDGDHCYYVEATNEFVVVSADGYIRTYFKPDKGKAYFDSQ